MSFLNDAQRWIEHEGVKYFKELGIGTDQIIVDFGCNAGHYTIPATHYLNTNERKNLYQSVNTVLKDNGILSVFPKHNQSDWPMWHLEKLSVTDIVKEIENNHFMMIQWDEKRIIHDDNIEKGMIINFKKCKPATQ